MKVRRLGMRSFYRGVGVAERETRHSEGQIDSAASHAEIIVASIHNVPTKVVDESNARRKANLEASAELADYFGLAAADERVNRIRSRRLSQKVNEFGAQILCSARNEPCACESVRGKSGSTDWIT